MRTQQTVARHLLLLSALVLPLDQVLKWLTREYLHETYEYFLGPLFIRFELAENPGAFLSLGSSWSDATRFWVLTVMVTGILVWAAWTLFRKREMPAYEYW
ncbi:MAG: signal peptidase II, partial [Bdellovibrionaceae bacterium]|nr:signal peptidase II [Pseudobdellovibrionaceae bacterium]